MKKMMLSLLTAVIASSSLPTLTQDSLAFNATLTSDVSLGKVF